MQLNLDRIYYGWYCPHYAQSSRVPSYQNTRWQLQIFLNNKITRIPYSFQTQKSWSKNWKWDFIPFMDKKFRKAYVKILDLVKLSSM